MPDNCHILALVIASSLSSSSVGFAPSTVPTKSESSGEPRHERDRSRQYHLLHLNNILAFDVRLMNYIIDGGKACRYKK